MTEKLLAITEKLLAMTASQLLWDDWCSKHVLARTLLVQMFQPFVQNDFPMGWLYCFQLYLHGRFPTFATVTSPGEQCPDIAALILHCIKERSHPYQSLLCRLFVRSASCHKYGVEHKFWVDHRILSWHKFKLKCSTKKHISLQVKLALILEFCIKITLENTP